MQDPISSRALGFSLSIIRIASWKTVAFFHIIHLFIKFIVYNIKT